MTGIQQYLVGLQGGGCTHTVSGLSDIAPHISKSDPYE